MHAHVDACACTQGLCEHRQRVCTDILTVGEKCLAASRNRTCISIMFGFSVRHSTESQCTPCVQTLMNASPIHFYCFLSAGKLCKIAWVFSLPVHASNVHEHTQENIKRSLHEHTITQEEEKT